MKKRKRKRLLVFLIICAVLLNVMPHMVRATNAVAKETAAMSGEKAVDQSEKEGGTFYITGVKEWKTGHWMWQKGTSYVFCLVKGKVMNKNCKLIEKTGAYGSDKNTFRIAVALAYFAEHGTEKAYRIAQSVIWNETGTGTSSDQRDLDDLDNYIDHYTALTFAPDVVNVTPIGHTAPSEFPVAAGTGGKAVKSYQADMETGDDNVVYAKKTINMTSKDWVYFAKSGAISATVYDKDGNVIPGAAATVTKEGPIHVSVPAAAVGTEETTAATVVFSLDKVKYKGSLSIRWGDGADGTIQDIGISKKGSLESYFAIRIYAPNTTRLHKPAYMTVNKTDPYGNPVDGGIFTVSNQSCTWSTDVAPGQPFECWTDATYYISEKQAPAGMVSIGAVGSFIVSSRESTDAATGIKIIQHVISSHTVYPNVVADNPDGQGLHFYYQVPNDYGCGNAKLRKTGNMFVGWDGTRFVYQSREMGNVKFTLHARNDLYVGNTLFYKKGEEVTQDGINAKTVNNVKWGDMHPASFAGTTDNEGYIHYYNLPTGDYYVVETGTINGYYASGGRIEFTVKNGGNAGINDPEKEVINEIPDTKVVARKMDTDHNPLAGAEITFYAHISNTNFDGYRMFTADMTAPAVVSRAGGRKKLEKNQWIPLETLTTDETGTAFSKLKIPYGRYLLTETKPPENKETGEPYKLAEDSYEFEFKEKTAEELKNAPNGFTFEHTFTDKEQKHLILVKKTGQLLSKAETKVDTAVHQPYCQLIYQDMAAADIAFEISDENGNVVECITTDENGEAVSSNLEPGIYYVTETFNGGTLRIDEKPKKVELTSDTVSPEQVEIKTVAFTNEALNVKLAVYKDIEEFKPVSNALQQPVYTPFKMYTFTSKKADGVVFGIFAGDDMKNGRGTIIVKKDSCLGYGRTVDGKAEFDLKLPEGSYYCKEVRTKDGHYMPDERKYDFTVTLAGKDLEVPLNQPEEPLLNKAYRGSIKVIKTDGTKKMPLKDVLFTLYDANKNALGRFFTDDRGEILIEDLPVGKYYLLENQTREGYALDSTTREIDLTSAGLHQVIELENDLMKGSVRVIKTDGETKATLPDVEFTLYDKKKKPIGTFITDENGEIYVDSLEIDTYYLMETEAREGYVLDATMYEIHLTDTQRHKVLEIQNTRKLQTPLVGKGTAKTGDDITRLVGLVMLAAFGGCCFTIIIKIR